MNKIYGFEGEVLFKYDTVVMGLFSEVSERVRESVRESGRQGAADER